MTSRAVPFKECNHGVSMDPASYCPECELAWHESALLIAQAAVDRHRHKISAANAAIQARAMLKETDQ
jgi:hypothetical protein